jgi:glycosyltransferase involved in cell wall biosynthesis
MATLVSNADKLVTVSNVYAKKLHRLFPGFIKERVIPIPNGLDIKSIEGKFQTRDYSRSKPILAIGGRITPEKGFTVVLEVLPEIAEHFDVKIFGGTQNPHLKYQLEHIKSDNAEYVGELSREDTLKLLRQSDAFLTASLHAPFEYMPIEALASGAVPIVTNVGAHVENFRNVFTEDKGTAGIMEPITDDLLLTEQYQKVINSLRESVVGTVTIAAKAIKEDGLRDKVHENFVFKMDSENPWSIERFVNEYEMVYKY